MLSAPSVDQRGILPAEVGRFSDIPFVIYTIAYLLYLHVGTPRPVVGIKS